MLTKRTPCFLPTESFPLQRATRTIWLTTRTSDPSRSPKWGGRNELSIHLKEQTRVCLSGRCSDTSSQQFPLREEQSANHSWSVMTRTSSFFSLSDESWAAVVFCITDWLQLNTSGFLMVFFFSPESTHFKKIKKMCVSWLCNQLYSLTKVFWLCLFLKICDLFCWSLNENLSCTI